MALFIVKSLGAEILWTLDTEPGDQCPAPDYLANYKVGLMIPGAGTGQIEISDRPHFWI